jgi:DNA-binding XRE family transcriptional regulator/DNA-binding transcriptional ArsR family regulator
MPHSEGGFGERLRALRSRAGLSQEELAERSGLASRTISRLELGHCRRPHPESARRLAEALQLRDAEHAGFMACARWRQAAPGSNAPDGGRPDRAVDGGAVATGGVNGGFPSYAARVVVGGEPRHELREIPALRPGCRPRAGAPGAPGALPVSVVLAPQQSMVALVLQVATGQPRGAPVGLLTAVRDALRPRARFAAQPFTARGWIPDACMPIPPLADASVADQAAWMRDLPAAALTTELHAANGAHPCPPHWRAAADQPRRWLNAMADASLDTWTVAQPRWRAAGPLLDREIRRVGTAAVRGAMPALLNSLHPRVSYHNGTFAFSYPCSGYITLCPVGPRRLALLPMIAGRDMVLFSFEHPDVCWIGYPLPQPRPGAHITDGSALATILGPVRAAILQALRQPLTVGDLAAAVYCAPTTVTYHLHQLAAAGLITRQKSGPAIWVNRTTRANDLVGLLSDPIPPHGTGR